MVERPGEALAQRAADLAGRAGADVETPLVVLDSRRVPPEQLSNAELADALRLWRDVAHRQYRGSGDLLFYHLCTEAARRLEGQK